MILMSHATKLPSYFHLCPGQIESLSFRVSLRCGQHGTGIAIADANNGNVTLKNDLLLSKDLKWQEKVPKPSKASLNGGQVGIFTYTNADAVPNINTRGGNAHGFSLREDVDLRRDAEFNDRLHREDPCQIMVILAAVGFLAGFHEEVLCVIKCYSSGLVSSQPALSEVECEDCDDNRVFISQEGINEVTSKGQRLTTYSFVVAGLVYEYTVEWNQSRFLNEEAELWLAEQNNLDREILERRRGDIRKEFQAFDCMHQHEASWDMQAHVEIVSASGFDASNFLLSAPHGPSVVIRYRVIKPGWNNKAEEIISKGVTSTVHSYSTVCGTLEFVTRFVTTFVFIAFVSVAVFFSLSDS